MKTKVLKREFVYNGQVLPDPNPAMTPEEVVSFYSNEYPDMLNAKIDGPKVTSSKVTYKINKIVGTKG